jgi:DNA polymerase epsilon subunit 2
MLTLYTEGFEALADLLASYAFLTTTTHTLLIPGPLDLTPNAVLPRRPLLGSLTKPLRSRLGGRVHFGSNPCRVKFCGQELVVFREDLMARSLRNLVGVKPDAGGADLKRFVSVNPRVVSCSSLSC